jgi:hypothetical protein
VLPLGDVVLGEVVLSEGRVVDGGEADGVVPVVPPVRPLFGLSVHPAIRPAPRASAKTPVSNLFIAAPPV